MADLAKQKILACKHTDVNQIMQYWEIRLIALEKMGYIDLVKNKS